MASRIEGMDALLVTIEKVQLAAVDGVAASLHEDMLACQQEAVALCPVHTGAGRALLASPAAVTITGPARHRRITFAAPRDAWYLKFVEFGTKAYAAGGTRRAGKTKSGKQRFQKVKKARPAHRAFPFFRPAVANLVVRVRRAHNIRRVVAGLMGR